MIHLAAYFDFLDKPSLKYDQITVEGTRRLLRGLREGFEVEKFIVSSAMLVHAPGESGQFITKDWLLEPTWAYTEPEVRAEKFIRAERGDISVVMLRFRHTPNPAVALAARVKRVWKEFTGSDGDDSIEH